MNVASLQSKLDESQAKVDSFNTQVATLQVCVYNVMYMYKHTCDMYIHVHCMNFSTCIYNNNYYVFPN